MKDKPDIDTIHDYMDAYWEEGEYPDTDTVHRLHGRIPGGYSMNTDKLNASWRGSSRTWTTKICHGFDMSDWLYETGCGTAGCIAGSPP